MTVNIENPVPEVTPWVQ